MKAIAGWVFALLILGGLTLALVIGYTSIVGLLANLVGILFVALILGGIVSAAGGAS